MKYKETLESQKIVVIALGGNDIPYHKYKKSNAIEIEHAMKILIDIKHFLESQGIKTFVMNKQKPRNSKAGSQGTLVIASFLYTTYTSIPFLSRMACI